jgi:hypothetical protein
MWMDGAELLVDYWSEHPPVHLLVAGALGFNAEKRSRKPASMGQLAARFGGKVMPGGRCV